MTKIPAAVFSKIEGSMISDDGNYMLLKTLEPDGNEMILAFPSEELMKLIQSATLSRFQSRTVKNVDPAIREVHNTVWWEIGKTPENNLTVLTLTLESGGKLDFGLPGGMPEAIRDTLAVLTGQTTGQPQPGTIPN